MKKTALIVALFLLFTCISPAAFAETSTVDTILTAGTTQAFVPDEYVGKYKETLESVFGKDSVYVLNVRKDGAVKLI